MNPFKPANNDELENEEFPTETDFINREKQRNKNKRKKRKRKEKKVMQEQNVKIE